MKVKNLLMVVLWFSESLWSTLVLRVFIKHTFFETGFSIYNKPHENSYTWLDYIVPENCRGTHCGWCRGRFWSGFYNHPANTVWCPRLLEDVFSVKISCLPRCTIPLFSKRLEDVLKMSWKTKSCHELTLIGRVFLGFVLRYGVELPPV